MLAESTQTLLGAYNAHTEWIEKKPATEIGGQVEGGGGEWTQK